MAGAIIYTLPTLQLVCHLVSTGNQSIYGTTPDTSTKAIEVTSPSPSSNLPTGYVPYPDFGVAYNVHYENLTWAQARDACAREGAHLANIDTSEKVEALRDRLRSLTYTSIKLINGTWQSSNPDVADLVDRKLPWDPSEPWGGGDCALMKEYSLGRLGAFSCSNEWNYICEIPYSVISPRLAVDIP